MKKISLFNLAFLIVLLCSCKNSSTGYVDLGLPSGTLWNSINESEYYSYYDAINTFGKNLPSKEQWEELKDVCVWTWQEDYPLKYKVAGPNGKHIFLPTTGFYDCNGEVAPYLNEGNYWSSSNEDANMAWNLHFDYEDADTYQSYGCYKYAVRLIKSGL